MPLRINVGVNRAKIMSVEARHVYAKTNPQESKQASGGSEGTPHRSHSSHILHSALGDAEQGQSRTFPECPNLHAGFLIFFFSAVLSSASMSEKPKLPQAS